MKLINIDTLLKTELRIQPDKKIGDGTINEINLLKRNPRCWFCKAKWVTSKYLGYNIFWR